MAGWGSERHFGGCDVNDCFPCAIGLLAIGGDVTAVVVDELFVLGISEGQGVGALGVGDVS